MKTRTYSELLQFQTIEERFAYLSLEGVVGESTFGFDRWLNQRFYRSREWRHIRNHVISRDGGCDLGVDGYDIHTPPHIHHMNRLSEADLKAGDPDNIDPEFLVTVTQRTHNAIHWGNESLLPKQLVIRAAGDTRLW
jgi:hypothetical protein